MLGVLSGCDYVIGLKEMPDAFELTNVDAADPPICPNDDFTGNLLHQRWRTKDSHPEIFIAQSNVLVIGIQPTSTLGSEGIITAGPIDLTNGYVQAMIVDVPEPNTDTNFGIVVGDDVAFRWKLSGTQQRLFAYVAGQEVSTLPYDAVSTKYLRFSFAGSMAFWSTSRDGLVFDERAGPYPIAAPTNAYIIITGNIVTAPVPPGGSAIAWDNVTASCPE
jgi:hypothetical protein